MPCTPSAVFPPAECDRMVRLLMEWAGINSGSGNAAGLRRMLAALRAEFASIPGATTEEVPLAGTEARALRVRMRPGAPVRILMSGHFDTVYGPDHPFQTCAEIEPGVLRGPGVSDMKGGLIVMLSALRRFESLQPSGRIGWEVLLTPDEEIGSPHSAAQITASAAGAAFALVFEPARANGNLVRARMGTGIFTLDCRGRAAHAGRDPAAGRNAILALAEVLPLVDAMGRDSPDILANIGRIEGGGAVNIVPDRALAEVNLRVRTVAAADTVVARLGAIAARVNAREGYRLEVSGKFNRPPKEILPPDEALFAAWRSCGADLGVALDWQDVAGGSDGNLISAAGVPNLDGIGVVGDHLHSSDEYVRTASLPERAAIAASFLARIDRGDTQLRPDAPNFLSPLMLRTDTI